MDSLMDWEQFSAEAIGKSLADSDYQKLALPVEFRHLLENRPIGSDAVHMAAHPSYLSARSIKDSGAFLLTFPLNILPDIDHFLVTANNKLSTAGLLVGWADTYETHRDRHLVRNADSGRLTFAWECLWHRFFPKIPLIGQSHRLMFEPGKKLMSKVEMMGRLVAAGFELVEEKILDGRQVFIAKKKTSAESFHSGTYYPLVKLKRIGLGGREFNVYKLRTMYPYAEFLQEMVYEKNRLAAGGKFSEDFRVSTLGKLLRKVWLDEVPMIWNLLRGDIKLVGVRPLSRHYFNLYSEDIKAKRTQFRPGLLPPFYADLPKTLEEIVASEMKYLQAYEKSPYKTDMRYFFKILGNIIWRGARSA